MRSMFEKWIKSFSIKTAVLYWCYIKWKYINYTEILCFNPKWSITIYHAYLSFISRFKILFEHFLISYKLFFAILYDCTIFFFYYKSINTLRTHFLPWGKVNHRSLDKMYFLVLKIMIIRFLWRVTCVFLTFTYI